VLPGWERDPIKVLPNYFRRAWHRIETAREFGGRDEGAKFLITQIAEMGGDSDLAAKVWRSFTDTTPRNFNALVQATRTFNIVTLLSTAGIAQLAQAGNTIAYVGLKNYLHGLGALFTKAGRAWSDRTGAYVMETVQDLIPTSEQGMASKWLRWIGLTPLDEANRATAALAGRLHAAEIAEGFFRSGGKNDKLSRGLVRIGIDPADVMKQNGILSPQQRSFAAMKVSDITQFRGSILDLPIARDSAAGQFLYLFKSFSLQQAKFVHGYLLPELKRGNPGPVLRFAASMGTLGAGVGETVRILRGRKQEDDPRMEYLKAVLLAGAFGAGGDILVATANGPDAIARFLVGPNVSQLTDLLSESYDAAHGDYRGLMRDAIRHAPIGGPALANWFVPKE
jgi:hypothetical protein